MNNIYSSGNEVVDQIGQMYFSGNIIPTTWYKTIVRDNQKPYLNAIIILSNVVYWYRPTEVRDEQSGQVKGFKKKFRDDLLQRSYQQIADQFGMSKREATNAVVFLENLSVIEREFRTIKLGSTILNNVLYLKLTAEWENTLTKISLGQEKEEKFIKEIESMMNNIVKMYSHISDENKDKFQNNRESLGKCPRCKSDVFEGKKNYYCSNKECNFSLFKEDRFFVNKKKKLTKDMVKCLLSEGIVEVESFYSQRTKKYYKALLYFEDTGEYINYKLKFK